MDIQKNVPLTRAQVKDLPVKRGTMAHGSGLAFINEFPNRRERRGYKLPIYGKSNNRKITGKRKLSRIRQVIMIVTKQMTKFGEINIPTGFTKTIIHRLIPVKLQKAAARFSGLIFSAKNRVNEDKVFKEVGVDKAPELIVNASTAEMLKNVKAKQD